MIFRRRDYSEPGAKMNDFWTGAVFWLIFNIGLGIVLNIISSLSPTCEPYGDRCFGGQWLGAVALVANVAYFIVVGRDRPWLAFGAVGCVGAVFATVLVLGALTAVLCGGGFA